MPNVIETQPYTPPWVSRLIVGLLLASFLAAASAGLGVWKQSALIEQRITGIDDKYIDKSGRVVARLTALELAFGKHLTGDNEHQLMIQRQHISFENFMSLLDDAHKDIEQLKHRCEMMEKTCCGND